MKVSKDWRTGNTQLARTGLFRMVRLSADDGLPMYRNRIGQYLYFWNTSKEWRIGEDPTSPEAGVSSAPMSYFDCPNSVPEWWAFANGTWTTAVGFQVSGTNCPQKVTVSHGEKAPSQFVGRYEMNFHCSTCPAAQPACFCKPVYEHKDELGLGGGKSNARYFAFFSGDLGEWRIGDNWQTPGAYFTADDGGGRACPTDVIRWKRWNGGSMEWERDPDLTVSAHSAISSIYDPYSIVSTNTVACPQDTAAMNESACSSVSDDLEVDFAVVVNEDDPAGCILRSGPRGDVKYNAVAVGKSSSDFHLVCERTPAYWQHFGNNLRNYTSEVPLPLVRRALDAHSSDPDHELDIKEFVKPPTDWCANSEVALCSDTCDAPHCAYGHCALREGGCCAYQCVAAIGEAPKHHRKEVINAQSSRGDADANNGDADANNGDADANKGDADANKGADSKGGKQGRQDAVSEGRQGADAKKGGEDGGDEEDGSFGKGELVAIAVAQCVGCSCLMGLCYLFVQSMQKAPSAKASAFSADIAYADPALGGDPAMADVSFRPAGQ